MPLAKQTVSIPFEQGLDTKTDEKLVLPGKLTLLENGVFQKGRKIRKRNGLLSLPNNILGSTTEIVDGDGMAVFEDELILFGDDSLYTFNDANEAWTNKGALTSTIATQNQILANTYQQTIPDMAHNAGITLYAWKDSRGGVRASVFDEATGGQIQSDVVIDASGDLPRCHAIAGFLYVFYKNSNNLRFKRISTGAPQTFSASSDIKTDLNTTESWFDVVTFGSRMVMVYHKNDNTIHLFFMSSTGIPSPVGSPAEVTIAERAKNSLAVFNLNDTQIFVGWHNNTAGLRCRAFDANFNALFAITTLDADATNNFVNLTGMKSSTTNTVRWFYEQSATATYNTVTKQQTITTAGSIGTAAVFKRSVGLGTKAFQVGTKSYVTLTHDSTQQATYFLATETGNIVARLLQWRGGGLRGQPVLAAVAALTATRVSFAASVKNRIEVENNVAFTTNGVNQTILDFDDDPAFTGRVLGKNLHIVGGQLFDYDGLNIVEHGFHLFPENIEVDVNRFVVVKKQDGTAGLPEISHVSFPHGDKITGGQYWTLTSATPTNYYVWYTKDGVGVDPAPGGKTAIPVAILSTDNGDSVATKTKTALDAVGGAPFITTRTNNTLVVTNAANAAVTDTANFDMGTIGFAITITTQGTSGAAEVTSIVCPAASAITSGEYFLLYSATDAKAYYVWFEKDSGGGDPKPSGKIGIKVAISTGNTASQVATALQTALDVMDDFSATVATNTVTCTNVINGVTTDASNINVAGGSMANGEYLFAVIYQWQDSKQQIHRSAPSSFITAKLSGFASNDGKVTLEIPPLRLTDKTNVVIHVFRSEAEGSVLYRRTSVTSPKFNDTTIDKIVFTDQVADLGIIGGEILYTVGGRLPNHPPPSSRFTTVHNNRLWAITDEKNVLWYSKEQATGEAVAFTAFFARKIDPEGGEPLGLASLDNNLIIFKSNRIRAIAGRGPDDAGGNNDLSNDFLVTSDVGLEDVNSIVVFDGGLLFKSDKGIHLLDRSLRVSYIGAPVEAYNDSTITSAVLVDGANQVRFTTRDNVALVWDYFYDQWSVFTNYVAEDAVVFQGLHHIMRSDGTVKKENTASKADDGAKVALKMRTAWLKVNSIQGFQRVYWASLLGEYLTDHQLQIDIAYDYEPVIADTLIWSPTAVINTSLYGSGSPYGADAFYGGSVGADNVYQVRFRPPRQKCQAIQFTIQDIMGSTYAESYSLSDLALEIGVKRGINRMRSAKTL